MGRCGTGLNPRVLGWQGEWSGHAGFGRTRRRERLEENTGSTHVALSADDIADLNAAAAAIGVHGNRYNDHHMNLVER